jgi:hypothetical protein
LIHHTLSLILSITFTTALDQLKHHLTHIEHNDCGANCFITNSKEHFTQYTPRPLQVCQLDGSIATAEGFELKLIQCPISKHIIPLRPKYYMLNNDHPTLSPTALKHYLKYPKVVTQHLDSLQITTSTGLLLEIPSIPKHSNSNVLDYHLFNIIKRISYPVSPTIAQANISQLAPLTRSLIHQQLAHCNHRKILST